MRRSMVHISALTALLALAVPAAAQDRVTFETAFQGLYEPGFAEGQHVIRSQQEFNDLGLSALIPPNVRWGIDWDEEMLVAVFMGEQTSGGYDIDIVEIEREQLLTIQPVPTPPPSFELVVRVRETRPGPADAVLRAITGPYHVVKCRRIDDRVRFETVGGGAQLTGLLPVRVIAQGATAPQSMPAGDHVLKSQQELSDSGLDQLFDPRAFIHIDWDTEMLVGVVMGSQSTGGYGVTIGGITRQEAPTVIPHRQAYSITVNVIERSPGPNDIVTRALTNPYVIVATRRYDDAISFQRGPGAVGNFDAITRSSGSITQSTSIEVTADGSVTVYRRQGPTADTERFDGTATPADMNALRQALFQVDLYGLPTDLGQGRPGPAGGNTLRYQLRGGSQGDVELSGDGPAIPFATRAQLAPLDQALDAIQQRILSARFDALTLSITTPEGNDSFTVATTIEADGGVVIESEYALREIFIQPVNGTATEAELAALERALRDADLTTLPSQLPRPLTVRTPSSFTLGVSGTITKDVHGDPDVLGNYEGRLRPVFDAVAAIRARLEHPVARGPSGVLSVRGRHTLITADDGTVYRLSDRDLAVQLRVLDGRRVTLEGDLAEAGQGRYQVSDATLIAPEYLDDAELPVSEKDGDLWLVVENTSTAFSGLAEGAIRAAYTATAERAVTIDGYLFRNAAGQPEEVLLTSVGATSRRFSALTRRGFWSGFAMPGEAVRILGLSPSGDNAFVYASPFVGYMPLDRLDVGHEASAAAATTGTPTRGLVGALDNEE